MQEVSVALDPSSPDLRLRGLRESLAVTDPYTPSQDSYSSTADNTWKSPLEHPLSTFSTDVDTASYSNVRRMIRDGQPVPAGAVRTEEFINYFSYDYPQPEGNDPFSVAPALTTCPWNPDHQLLRIGLQAKSIERSDRPAANLVFLIDVSGSMNDPSKLPLLKRSINVLTEELNASDRISVVVYAGSTGLALPATKGSEHTTITAALEQLSAGGSTNGGAGIELAYRLAQENFIADGINRVLLCTDGDFNVGVTGDESLTGMVVEKAKDGVFLSVLGFGRGNLNDAMLESITNHGNGTYYYIDSFLEARKVFLKDLMGTLVTVAKDVKIQIEFNPAHVGAYRLVGYANRMLAPEDFADDKKDAGEVGAGHTVTALYEIMPPGAASGSLDLRYQKNPTPRKEIVASPDLATVMLRYKKPDGDNSILMEQPIGTTSLPWEQAGADFRFASSAGLFGMVLRGSDNIGDSTLNDVLRTAGEITPENDPDGSRREFVELVKAVRR